MMDTTDNPVEALTVCADLEPDRLPPGISPEDTTQFHKYRFRRDSRRADWWGVYLHGEVADECGFDVPRLVRPARPELFASDAGVVPCNVITPDGRIVMCVMVYWHAEDRIVGFGDGTAEEGSLFRGYIVSITDHEEIIHAFRAQTERPKVI